MVRRKKSIVLAADPYPPVAERVVEVLPTIPERPAKKDDGARAPSAPGRMRVEWTDFVYMFGVLCSLVVIQYTHSYDLGLITVFAGAIAQLLALCARS